MFKSFEAMLDAANALDQLNKIYDVIRKIRDQKGDDRCWKDYEDLFKLLPEGYEAPVRDIAIELENCKWFLECARNPKTTYVSPQRRIEELEKQVEDLKLQISNNGPYNV